MSMEYEDRKKNNSPSMKASESRVYLGAFLQEPMDGPKTFENTLI